ELGSGTLVGVGADKLLRARATLTEAWALIPDSGDVVAVAELPDGALLGVKEDGRIYIAGRTKLAARPPAAGPPTTSPASAGSRDDDDGKRGTMDPKDQNTAKPGETWTLAEPHEGGEHLHATGLEDYGYWLRWKES